MKQTSKGIAVTLAIAAAVGASLLAMLAVLSRTDQTVGLYQEIQYDDFAFSVQDVRNASSLGNGESQATQAGREFRLSENGQRALEATQGAKCSGPIPAGASCTTKLAFEVPENVHVPMRRISEGGTFGDILDFVFYGTKRIALGSSE